MTSKYLKMVFKPDYLPIIYEDLKYNIGECSSYFQAEEWESILSKEGF